MSKLLLVLVGIVWILLGAATGVLALFTPFLFDAPGASSNLATIAFCIGIVGGPPACLISLVGIWRALRSPRTSRGWQWAALPLLTLAIAGAGWAWIMLVQDGKFSVIPTHL